MGKASQARVAAKNPRPITVELLLERGANIAAIDNSGRAALHYAAVSEGEEVI